MRVKCIHIFLLAITCALSLATYPCIPEAVALEKPLRTELANVAELQGSFTLILYGGRFLDDVETIAILDVEGDQYHFEPYAPDFDFRVKKGIPAKEALSEAQKFVSFHNAFWRSQLSRILDNNGKTIGYELRPLYYHFVYGTSDLMDVYYWLKEAGRVKVTIRLDPEIEKMIRFPGGIPGGGCGN